jgi:hypothetical protein
MVERSQPDEVMPTPNLFIKSDEDRELRYESQRSRGAWRMPTDGQHKI